MVCAGSGVEGETSRAGRRATRKRQRPDRQGRQQAREPETGSWRGEMAQPRDLLRTAELIRAPPYSGGREAAGQCLAEDGAQLRPEVRGQDRILRSNRRTEVAGSTAEDPILPRAPRAGAERHPLQGTGPPPSRPPASMAELLDQLRRSPGGGRGAEAVSRATPGLPVPRPRVLAVGALALFVWLSRPGTRFSPSNTAPSAGEPAQNALGLTARRGGRGRRRTAGGAWGCACGQAPTTSRRRKRAGRPDGPAGTLSPGSSRARTSSTPARRAVAILCDPAFAGVMSGSSPLPEQVTASRAPPGGSLFSARMSSTSCLMPANDSSTSLVLGVVGDAVQELVADGSRVGAAGVGGVVARGPGLVSGAMMSARAP